MLSQNLVVERSQRTSSCYQIPTHVWKKKKNIFNL